MTFAEKIEQARTGAAFGPLLERGLLRLTGKHRLPFLHRISTQRLAKLEPGESAYTCFLDVKAHVVAEGTVAVREDDLVLVVAPDAAEPLAAYLKKYIIMDDVKVARLPEDVRILPVFGDAAAVASQAAPSTSSFRTARHGPVARDFIVAPEDAGRLRAALGAAGVPELDHGELEALRIMAGVPRWGAEIDPARLVLETGIVQDAVAFDKGCYIGQEVVARGTFRGQVQRGLVQLEVPVGTPAPSPITSGGQEVGTVTSVAATPEGTLALGYLRRAFWNEGQRLSIGAGEGTLRRVLVQERDDPGAKRGGLLSRPPPAR